MIRNYKVGENHAQQILKDFVELQYRRNDQGQKLARIL